MKRTILAVSAFAASLMVSAVAVSAPVQAEEIFHSRKAVAEVVATTPLYEAQDDTQTTTTTTDLSGGNNVETTTTLDSSVTSSEETTTTTTTVPLQVVTVNATLHASFNGDKEDAPSTPLSISSDSLQESYTISCDLTDPSKALDYVYLDFALPDAKQSIRTFCPNFTPAVTKVSTGADLLTDVPYTMGANAETLSGLTGIGDLIVTCESKHSRNRKAGMLMGQGYTMKQAMDEVKMVVEGVYSAKAAIALARKYEVAMPIIEEINHVLFDDKPAKDAVRELMLRDRREEHSSLEWEE